MRFMLMRDTGEAIEASTEVPFEEIARAFLVLVATVQQRIVRAKRTIGAARAPCSGCST